MLVKCKECGSDISSDAKTCPHCGKNVSRPSSCLIILVGSIILGIILFWGMTSGGHKSARNSYSTNNLSSQNDRGNSGNPTIALSDIKIKYSIIREWDVPEDGYGVEVLVSPTITKTDAFKLGEQLRDFYMQQHSGRIYISVWDAVEAPRNRMNESYPLFKHYLIQINVNPNTGVNEMNWMKE